MQYAIVDGLRAEAAPGLQASCPCCSGPVIPKCGSQVVWHFAHERRVDCDPWAEGESRWHRTWKERFPADCREVVVGPHRADVLTPRGFLVEFQHSHLSAEEIAEREAFYPSATRSMSWLWDAVEPYESGRLSLSPGPKPRFSWSHARRSIAQCRQPVYLDLGDGTMLFVCSNLASERVFAEDWRDRVDPPPIRDPRAPFVGWGERIDVAEFLRRHPAGSAPSANVAAGGLF